ncbi:DUF2948 family protein [Methyloligella sp. 2.7D]|uniref:DUF2948 family protein n=1 Tax=unclassified Methyloligella TaxID=2625955 RepID=UPI00157C57B1|nr:DUF2948 family protein [Methyloligella sp. GL2]QKP78465.1 DUF2948 family protein [Methyloligella sp. GL2]
MTPLKLLALDDEDLKIISAHLQDAVLRVDDMAYLPAQKRFAAVLNRFDWEQALGEGTRPDHHRRRRAALRFDRVFNAQIKGVDPEEKGHVLSLLAIRFEPGDSPSGIIELTFSGDVTIRLDAECIEAELKDLGPVWQTKNKPEHPDAESGAGA